METIKFRAWNKETMRMWSHELMERSKVFALASALPHQDFLIVPNGKHLILMQYSGLKDDNGKEIYEGDILKDWRSGTEQVNPYIVVDLRELYLEQNRDDFYYTMTNCRVIGNIHENPELLKEVSHESDKSGT